MPSTKLDQAAVSMLWRTSVYVFLSPCFECQCSRVLLQSKAGCDHLANAIKAKESKIHILVNNSGATWGAPYDK